MLSINSFLRQIISFFALLLLLQVLSNCTESSKKKEKVEINELTIGTIAGPETDIMEVIKEVALEEHGIKLNIITFNDFMTPNIALEDGSIDANAYQHLPYLQDAMNARGFKFASIGQTFIYPVAGYSKKLTRSDEVAEKAKIAIPNDPTNEGRALLLLEKQGLIKLKEGVGLTALPADIVDNPKNLEIIEIEAAQLPRVLEDVDIAVINTVFAANADLNPSKDSLFAEGSESPYANIIAVREEDKNKDWTLKLLQAANNPKVAAAAAKVFSGNAIPAWN
ncbi:MAG: MetQ/NlpA family ABC transporter substrate-binding protein [Oligoflexales bacterium]|nr:MetQ/NlpA family ABC transporter substrate-binding protein [Oligoflexales bacterium]